MQDAPGYRLSMDPAELQLDVVHGFLTTCYWSPGVTRERVEKAVRGSLVVGAYEPGGNQVGFARLVTDYASFSWLADVFVLEGHRGRGLARRMVRTLLRHPEVQGQRRIVLATRDAHGVYRECGFEPLAKPESFMQIHRVEGYLAPAED